MTSNHSVLRRFAFRKFRERDSRAVPGGVFWCLVALIVGSTLLGVLSRPAAAQSVYGSIYGTVLDNSGAVVPNATVQVKSQQKDTAFSAQTNSVGQYRIDHLVPDTYNVTVSATGFKSFTVNNLQVNAGDTPKVDANLEIGSVSESVTVAASAEELLKTETQDVAISVPQEVVHDLPIVNQAANNLILLAPGAYATLGQGAVSAEVPEQGSRYTVNGQPGGGEDYTLDGTDNTSPVLGTIVINPSPDTLQEVKVITSSFTAEYGRALSAIIPMQTKSGSNSFHGQISDFRKSSANLARDPFSAAQSAPGGPAPALTNQFEFNLGGPIVKKRLFFFFDYYGQREKVGGSVLTTLPTSHLRKTCLGLEATSTGMPGCDFGEYLAQAGPLATIYQSDGTPYPGNVIPAAELSTQALNLLSMLPDPADQTSVLNNFSANNTGTFNTGQYTTRIDGQITPNIHAFGRYTYFHDVVDGKPVFGAAGGPSGTPETGHGEGHNHSLSLGMDYAISDHLLSDIRLGYYRYHIKNDMYNAEDDLADQLGIPGLNNTGAALTNGMPTFSISGSTNVGALALGRSGCNCPLLQDEDQFQIVNNWTRVFTTHTLKFGADLRYGRQLRVPSDQPRTGALTFGTGPTSLNGVGGLGLASFVLGDVTDFSRYVSKTSNAKEFQKRFFVYAQDTWRATRKLTINYGLRYEIYFPETVNAPGNGALLNLATGNLQVAGHGPFGTNMGQSGAFKNFGPRVGLSYQANEKTVLRAGFGRSFSPATYGSIFGTTPVQVLPVLGNQTLSPQTVTSSVFNLADGPPAFTFPTIPESGLIPLPDGIATATRPLPTLRVPTVDSWNATIQRALTPSLTATVAYVGNKGTHTFVGNWQYVFPNSPQAILPASQSVIGQTLYYDPSVSKATPDPFDANYPGIDANGHTANIFYLQPMYAKFGWTQPIQLACNCGDTHYDALQVTLEKRAAHGLTITGNYAYQLARNYDTAYYLVDKKLTYGPSDVNRDQVLTAFGVYQLPFGRQGDFFKSAPKWLDYVIGGYQLSPSINIASGQHFSATYSLCSTNLPPSRNIGGAPTGAPCYPDKVGSFETKLTKLNPVTHRRSYFTPVSTLNAANPTSGAWAMPGLGEIGNFKRNSLVGPKNWNVDLSASKSIPIREQLRFQFRVDAFNVFNHINPGNPVNSSVQFAGTACVDCATGGLITSQAVGYSPRQLLFAAKLQF